VVEEDKLERKRVQRRAREEDTPKLAGSVERMSLAEE